MSERIGTLERPGTPPEDPDLRDEHARSGAGLGYAAIVILDVIAIATFVVLVVVPRLT